MTIYFIQLYFTAAKHWYNVFVITGNTFTEKMCLFFPLPNTNGKNNFG